MRMQQGFIKSVAPLMYFYVFCYSFFKTASRHVRGMFSNSRTCLEEHPNKTRRQGAGNLYVYVLLFFVWQRGAVQQLFAKHICINLCPDGVFTAYNWCTTLRQLKRKE